MRNKLAMSALLLVAAVGLAACSDGPYIGTNTTDSTEPATHALTAREWNLSSYQGLTVSPTPAASGALATLAFGAQGALSGSTGCNAFGGTYTTSGTSMTITPGATTLIACSDPKVSEQETALLALLPQVTSYSVTPDSLRLAGSGGSTLLTYTAGLSGLSGSSWSATGVNNGSGAVESTTATEHLTAVFGPDGAFNGFGGCNNLSGIYGTSPSHGLEVSGLTSTRKSCGTEIDSLERQYTAALENVASYSISGDQLKLRNSGGETQATFVLAH